MPGELYPLGRVRPIFLPKVLSPKRGPLGYGLFSLWGLQIDNHTTMWYIWLIRSEGPVFMQPKELIAYRKKLGLTQKELARLLAVSLKAVHSYEQGWRNIPENVARQVLFLVSRMDPRSAEGGACWIRTRCPDRRKKDCPAWRLKAGNFCWFITGTLCQGRAHKSWSEKIEQCRTCPVFRPIREF